jgi:hypothetical protein
MKRGLFRLIHVREQASDEVHQKVRDAAVARVLDLRDVLELVDNGFDVTVANSKIDPLPPQAGVEHPAILEGAMQKGRRSGGPSAHRSPPLSESNTSCPLGDLQTAGGRDFPLISDRRSLRSCLGLRYKSAF